MKIQNQIALILLGVTGVPCLLCAADSPAIHPPFLVQADQDQVDGVQVTVHPSDGSAPSESDFATGLLTSSQPNYVARPKVSFKGAPAAGKSGDYTVTLSIEALMPFGDSSADLLYKGVQTDLLRFSRPGVGVSPGSGATFVARQAGPIFNPGPFLLVLDNHSSFVYKTVAARLRFEDRDFCAFEVAGKMPANPAADCGNDANWTRFSIPQYAQVSLLASNLPAEWFQTPGSSYARSGKSTGTLTLHFVSGGPVIHEQNLPLEVQFEPSTEALLRTVLDIFGLLALGAAISYLLRVSLPNMKRKRALKDQIAEANKSISGLPSLLDSRLRTLLGSECLAMDELRREVSPVAPNYSDYAKRAEQGLATLSRKVAFAQRLGSALERRSALTTAGYPYGVLSDAGSSLDIVSRQLQKNQMADDDWNSIDQTLKKAENLLEDQDPQAADSVNTALLKRWQSVREHFGPHDDHGALIAGPWTPPASIRDLKPFFDTLPKEFFVAIGDQFKQYLEDEDGTGGTADILIAGLEYAQFLETIAPPTNASALWRTERDGVCDLFLNLTTRKLFEVQNALWRLSENVFKDDVKRALSAGQARLVVDPENPSLNQSFRISVCFLDPRIGESTARDQLSCRWTLTTTMAESRSLLNFWQAPPRTTVVKHEDGWHAFHYLENRSVSVAASIEVSDDLTQVTLPAGVDFPKITINAQPNQNRKEKRARTILEVTQLAAALLVPLAALASSTVNGGGEGSWWSLIALGFGTDTIKNIITGKDDTAAPAK